MQAQTIQTLMRVTMGLLALLAILLVGTGLLAVRLSESRLVITCGSFSSYAEAQAFMKAHPAYASKLDRNHNGEACESKK